MSEQLNRFCCSLWPSWSQIPKLEFCIPGSFVVDVEDFVSAITLARLDRGQAGKLPFHQGHLCGRGLAAGGQRLEGASDAHPAQELGSLLVRLGVGYSLSSV